MDYDYTITEYRLRSIFIRVGTEIVSLFDATYEQFDTWVRSRINNGNSYPLELLSKEWTIEERINICTVIQAADGPLAGVIS